jgi:hypothetical protein
MPACTEFPNVGFEKFDAFEYPIAAAVQYANAASSFEQTIAQIAAARTRLTSHQH